MLLKPLRCIVMLGVGLLPVVLPFSGEGEGKPAEQEADGSRNPPLIDEPSCTPHHRASESTRLEGG